MTVEPVAPPSADRFAHAVQFYRGYDEYRAAVIPFVLDGLAADEPVTVAVPGPQLAVLCAELGTDADAVCWVDMAVTGRNPGWIIPGVLRAFTDAHPGRRTRMVGEPVWPGRTTAEYPACAQHEALINRALTGRDVTILCPYDRAGLGATALADAAATHPAIATDPAPGDPDGWHPSHRYAPADVLARYNRPLPVPTRAAARTVDAPEVAREHIAEQAVRAGLSPRRVTEATLVGHELVSNGIRYGNGSSALWAWTDGDTLVVQARNAGRLTDPLAGRLRPAAGESRGVGLLLVNRFADLVRIHVTDGHTTIRAYLAPH